MYREPASKELTLGGDPFSSAGGGGRGAVLLLVVGGSTL